jgi:hypothetical protein
VTRSGTINAPADSKTVFYLEDNLRDPYRIHLLRAQGHLKRGAFDHAMSEARMCLEYLPGCAEMPVKLVPVLERAGKKKEAGELFEAVHSTLKNVIASYPRYAPAQEQMKALLEGCNRKPRGN